MMERLTLDEAKTLVAGTETPPDDLNINNKAWQLESTYLTRKEAMGSAEFFAPDYRLFPYKHGFALYQRNYTDPEAVLNPGPKVLDWDKMFPSQRSIWIRNTEHIKPDQCDYACGLKGWLGEMILDEKKAHADYKDNSIVMEGEGLKAFSFAMRAMSEDERGHQMLVQAMLDVVLKDCNCP